ncbi:MAG: (d)CMP kinase [candidate division WOR-3 bacterium]|nr:(d)CMP kinase [candidate division WOR-3 bacterium]
MKFVVAIDGTASSGKSTTARLLAKKLGVAYLDTGAMYRAVTYLLLQEDALEASDRLLQKILLNSPLEFKIRNRKLCVYLDGKLLENELRTPEIDRWVSPVAKRALVRAFLVAKQREIGKRRRLVCEGRDIGSVVFPDAALKVFMGCFLDERARRRKKELEERGISRDIEEVKANLKQRDEVDSHRKLSPLTRTTDAFYVDTTHLTIEEQVALIEAEVRKRMVGK